LSEQEDAPGDETEAVTRVSRSNVEEQRSEDAPTELARPSSEQETLRSSGDAGHALEPTVPASGAPMRPNAPIARGPTDTRVLGTNDTPPPLPLSPDELVGHRLLDRYLIGQKIGAGGFGAVFEASDELKRAGGEESQIAIKVLEKHMIDDRIDVLIQEVSRSHQVSHPNILRVYELHIDRGLAFITMELLQGETLKQRLAEAHLSRVEAGTLLPLSEIDSMARQVCEALEYCHGQELVHADIKPDNIFLCSDGNVKVLDLGIAQIIGTPGRIRGYSASYASPEQQSGEPPHPKDDIFALGCVLYECLTGQRVQQANSGVSTEDFDSGSLPPRYRRAVASSLALERTAREGSAGAIWRKISPEARRRRWTLGAVAALVLVGLIGIGLLGIETGRGEIAVSKADQAIAEEAYRAALRAADDDSGVAQESLVTAIEANPYHVESAQLMAKLLLETPASNPVAYSLVWADFAKALFAAPRSEALLGAAREATDSLLAVDATALRRSEQKSRFGAPLCVLGQAGYRVEELERLRAELSLSC
jgi:serine/threonine protein kinase